MTGKDKVKVKESTLGLTLGEESTGLVIFDYEGHPIRFNQITVFEDSSFFVWGGTYVPPQCVKHNATDDDNNKDKDDVSEDIVAKHKSVRFYFVVCVLDMWVY